METVLTVLMLGGAIMTGVIKGAMFVASVRYIFTGKV